MAIADEVEPRPARAHAVACLALRHCVEGAGRTPLVCAACHCAAGPAAASKAIQARVRGVAAMRTALVAVGCVGVQGLRLEGRACVVAKGETEPTWARRRHARGNHFNQRGARNLRAVLADAGGNLSRPVISQAMYSPTRRSQVSSLRRKKPPSHRRQLAEAAPAQLPWR